MALQSANLILQATPGSLECIVDRKINVGVALVGIRLVPDIYFLFVRQCEPDMNLEQTAGPVVLRWTFQHHTAGRNSAEESRSRKSAQGDKWSFCLTAGTLWPANQERP